MTISKEQFEDAKSKLDIFCDIRIPANLKSKLNLTYSTRGNNITLYENRTHWQDNGNWSKMAVAQFRYDNKENTWTLYCADRNEKWFIYTEIDPSADIQDLIDEINEDPTCIFWG